MMLALQRYEFILKYTKGSDLVLADTMSRAYISGSDTERCDIYGITEIYKGIVEEDLIHDDHIIRQYVTG